MELKNFFAQDQSGNILPYPVIYVYQPGTTTLVSGLKDKDGAAIGNPFPGSSTGQVQFAAPAGDYDLRCVSGVRELLMRARFSDTDVRTDIASTATGKGASQVGFDPAVVPSTGSVALPLAASHTCVRSFLEKIPPSEWAAIFARTSTYDCSALFAVADAEGGTWTLPEGQLYFASGVEIIKSRWVGVGPSNGGAYGTVLLFNEATMATGAPAVKTRQSSSPRPAIGVENLTIKSSGWGGTHHGFDVEAKLHLRSVYAIGFSGRNFYAHHDSAGANGPYQSVWQDIYSMYSKDHGVVIGDGANNMTLINIQSKWSGAPSYLTAPSTAGSKDGFWSGSIPADGYPVYTPEGLSIIGGDCSYNARYGWNIDGASRSTIQINYSEFNKGAQNVRLGQNRVTTFININGTLGGASAVLINGYGATDNTNAVFLGGNVLGNGTSSWINTNKQLVLSTDPTLAKLCTVIPDAATGNATIGAYGGATLTIGSGAATALPLVANVQFSGVNTTGSGSAALGANCPATTLTAPYKWVRVLASDGTVCFMPIWK